MATVQLAGITLYGNTSCTKVNFLPRKPKFSPYIYNDFENKTDISYLKTSLVLNHPTEGCVQQQVSEKQLQNGST